MADPTQPESILPPAPGESDTESTMLRTPTPTASASGPARPSRRGRPAAEHLTQVVRRLAREHDVDLATIHGTGLEGRIRKQDVLDAVSHSPAAPAVAGAQLTSVLEIDLTRALANPDASVFTVVAKAVVDALRGHPTLSGAIDAPGATPVDLVFHLDAPEGLVTSAIAGAGDLSLSGLARRIDEIIQGAGGPSAAPAGPFTLVDGSGRGTLFDTPAVTRGGTAALALGSIVRKPVVLHDERIGETIAIRSMAHLALSYNPQRVSAADAAEFLTEVRTRLE